MRSRSVESFTEIFIFSLCTTIISSPLIPMYSCSLVRYYRTGLYWSVGSVSFFVLCWWLQPTADLEGKRPCVRHPTPENGDIILWERTKVTQKGTGMGICTGDVLGLQRRVLASALVDRRPAKTKRRACPYRPVPTYSSF